MADKKKSLKITADKKKSLKVSSPMADKKKSHTKKKSHIKKNHTKKKSHTKKSLIAEQKKSLEAIAVEESLKVSSPMTDNEKILKLDSYLFLSPKADIVKHVKPDSDIISILRKHNNWYRINHQREFVIPACELRPLDVVTKEPAPGVLAGRLVFKQGRYTVDCSKMGPWGTGIPYMVKDSIEIISSDALFILVVENSSAYTMLAFKEFYNRFPCIIITSEKARPDMGTTMFLKMVHNELNLPVLALVDSTAQGLKSLYWYYQNEIDIKWLGMRPSDLNKHGMPESHRLRMKQKDIKIVKGLLKYEMMNGWADEFNLMLSTKQMAEIEAFTVFDFKYLWEVYLPLMLQQQDWL